MELFDLIITGIAVNFILFIALLLLMLASMLYSVIVLKNFELILWAEKLKPTLDMISEHRKTLPFFQRNEHTIIKFIPFSGLLEYPVMMYGIFKHGFFTHIELEIVKTKKKYGMPL